jgi:hypothetical protein
VITHIRRVVARAASALQSGSLTAETAGHRPGAKKQQDLVPGARIELATPAFSGRRSTSELPRHG